MKPLTLTHVLLCKIVAPPKDGPRGTAILPSYNDAEDNPVSWSSLVTNGVVSCYAEDARIMVNSELIAASQVYAAGSVARFPKNGHAVVSGQGQEGSIKAGTIAATNMAAEFLSNNQPHLHVQSLSSTMDLPICRTDKLPHDTNTKTSSLSALGIHALMVGDCNSEDMSTHGFWWTTQASNQRDMEQEGMKYTEEDSTYDSQKEEQQNNNGGFTFLPGSGQVVRLLTRETVQRVKRPNSGLSSTNISLGSTRPIYGMGVVYYLDRNGRLRGVMTWGLPFEIKDDINPVLLDRIKDLIRTNCGPEQITFNDLVKETKQLVSIACKGRDVSENVFYKNGKLAKPLHCYAPSKHSSVTGLGALRRKDEYGNSENDKLYISDEPSCIKRPPALIYIAPMDDVGYQGYLWSQDPQQLKAASNANRFRPGKEDVIWLRQDEYSRSQSLQTVMNEAFRQNILNGRMPDGSDPIAQAPVPEIFTKLHNWYTSSSSEEDNYHADEPTSEEMPRHNNN